ncbi:efflux RND transporter periplasmic adaptor subunit [Pseudorhodoplanes sinuspersici]|nr:efflux RND transporter periplasmic adaptor subunit [Pseudorhodoplanes sinuspersici]RKE68406.1 HlyD family secretion protein [Pseudorhodoplanes sinuspersici]
MAKCMRAASVSIFALLYSAAHAQGPSAAVTVTAVSVEKTKVIRSITAMGGVVAWREILVGTEASGLAVTEIAVDEGDLVAKGQVLARLNDDRIRAEILKQKAAIDELEASLASARSDAIRARSVTSGVITAQTIEQRETLVKTTEARLEAARAQLLEIEARHRQTVIVAPAAGMIASRSVAIGQVMQTGTEMVRLVQENRIEVDARVLESDLLSAAVGQFATIIGPTGRPEHGVVRIISPIVDPKTRLGTVRIALSRDTHLKPGMFARVEIAVESKFALTVPLRALVWREAKAHVFKVSPDNLVALTEVRIGRGTTDQVEVLRGVDVGDRIVTQGAGFLNDGDTVNIETASVRIGAVR